MGQSLTAIYIHAVFRTKFSQPFIDQKIEKDLHAYISGILRNIECTPLEINSMPDHIHILFRQSKNFSISDIMQLVKKDSSKWMKRRGCKNFKWQTGYGAFSVSQRALDIVKKYVKNQKQNHKIRSHRKEIEEYMFQQNIEDYKEEYYWR